MAVFIGAVKKSRIAKLTKSNLLKEAKSIKSKGEYMNCHLFSQKLLKYVDKKTDLIKLKFNVFLNKNGSVRNLDKLNVGDLLEFGGISHYSVYLGDGNVVEVEQWGACPRVYKLIDSLKSYEETSSVYRSK
jgi:hypothetical protein